MNSVAALEQQAIDLAKRGDFGPDARTVNEELTRLSPTNQGAWTRLARCCLELGLLDDATAAADAALKLNPQNTIARNLQMEVSKRRAGPVDPQASTRRATGAPRAPRARSSSASGVASRATRTTAALAGIGRADFTALGHLAAAVAAESLSTRLDPLLMTLNERPFAAKIVDARNRAGHAGARLFRRGSLQPIAPGFVHVFQQGGRWEPQLSIGLLAHARFGRDALAAGIGFNLAAGGDDERAGHGRERVFEYFEAFQQLLGSTWRQHLTDWMRANGGFVQLGLQPPATDLLPYDAVERVIAQDHPGELGWIFVGRWLFADRGEDIAILTDGVRLVRWLEQTFVDLLPLWGTVYRDRYKS